jgi:hypothetical protein
VRSLLGVGCLFSTVATHVAFVRVSGVYDLTMFDTFLTLHYRCEESGGYSLDNYSYKISYSSLSRLFVLPHDDNDSDTLSIVISMKDPTQGGKMQFLIAQFPMQEDERTLSLNISEELLQNKYGGKLRREMTGPTWEIIYKVLRALSGKRGSVPKSFRSARGLHCVSCSVGDNAGKLYVLDTSFLFLNKQAIHLRFHGTAKVQVCPIQPQGAARRKEETWSRFNVTVTMQNGSQHTFKSLEKRELEPIVKFLQERGVGFQRQTARKQQQQQEEEQQEGAWPGPGTVTGEGALQPTRLVHTPRSWPQRRTEPLPPALPPALPQALPQKRKREDTAQQARTEAEKLSPDTPEGQAALAEWHERCFNLCRENPGVKLNMVRCLPSSLCPGVPNVCCRAARAENQASRER